jgi:hypothetical protein
MANCAFRIASLTHMPHRAFVSQHKRVMNGSKRANTAHPCPFGSIYQTSHAKLA